VDNGIILVVNTSRFLAGENNSAKGWFSLDSAWAITGWYAQW